MRTGTCDWCGGSFEDRSRPQKRRFCSDNCRKREHDDTTRRGVCASCGELMGSNSLRSTTVCVDCFRTAAAINRDKIICGYRDGLTAYEISERTGIPRNTVVAEAYRLRQAGVVGLHAPVGTPSHRANRHRSAA